MIQLFRRLLGRLPAILAVVLPLSLASARAQDILSERLTDQIVQMHRLDLNRRLQSDFEAKKQSLGDAETAERAGSLRELLLNRASTYELLDEFDRAEADYDALLAIKPLNPMIYSDRAYFYMRQSRYAEAVRDFMTGSRLAPTQAAFNYGAGRAFTRMGAYTQAVEQYTEAMRLAPTDSVPVLSRGEALIQLGEYVQARADFDRALALGLRRGDDRFFVYFGRGYADIFVGDFAGAVQDMDAALTARPGMVNAVVWRGYAREKMGERRRALDDYEAALRLNPKDGWIRSSISRVRS
jgi:tetratricopeptide (TPR) repeat protein